ncbi:hypothetical protein SAMN06265376_1123 [Dokdonia pacifica]|uniref:Uncharacterized protein n=1 Tax=Dokdonia pacifica TaxID=1627892 RepID=A0A239DP80_9FLAO|nr:hypothetical protein SAMN06265376_1123 [Dokdonia pacifica]
MDKCRNFLKFSFFWVYAFAKAYKKLLKLLNLLVFKQYRKILKHYFWGVLIRVSEFRNNTYGNTIICVVHR